MALGYEAVGDAQYWSYVKRWKILAGFRLFKPDSLMAGVPTAFPVRPLWPGFAANSGMAAGGWLVLLYAGAGLGLARGRWRLWRVRCPRCAYQLGEADRSRCSECGWAVRGPQTAH